MSVGFSVSAPGLQALSKAMKRTDPVEKLYRPAAREVAHSFAAKVLEHATVSNAAPTVKRSIGVFDVNGVIHAGSTHPDAHAHEFGGEENQRPTGYHGAADLFYGDEHREMLATKMTERLDQELL
jgi:hypothetical protein